MHLLERSTERLAKALTFVAAVCIVAMMLQVMLDVTLRYAFAAPIPGTAEIVSAYYMIGVVFLPLAMVQRERGHVMIELFTMWMRPRSKALMDAAVLVVCAAALVIFTYSGIEKAIAMTARDEIRVGLIDVTVWPSRWFVPFGCGAMAIVMVLQAIHELLFGLGLDGGHQEAKHTEDAEQV
ncbi:TRAP transporter small permease [Ferruginivarius sediminum]|nr:TRAP transporter small permease [Ferruginivarius sediminum]